MLDSRTPGKQFQLDLTIRANSTLAEGLNIAKLHPVALLLLLTAGAGLGHRLSTSTPLVFHAEDRLAGVNLHLVLLVLEKLLLDLIDCVLVPV